VELLSETRADLQFEVGCYGDVTLVEETMEIGAEEEPIANLMWAC
jgi:hypothetical protein